MPDTAALPTDWWTSSHVAEYLGVSVSTVRSLKSRKLMPQPDRTYERTPLWKPATIKKWHASRPRKGTGQ